MRNQTWIEMDHNWEDGRISSKEATGYVKEVEYLHNRCKIRQMIVKGMVTILLFAMLLGMKTRQTSADVQKGIADKIIRFHVLANSDSEKDQKLKLQVKKEVVELMQQYLKGVSSKEEAEKILLSHQEEIKQKACLVIRKNGYQYGVRVVLEDTEFPVKKYGDLTFPAGKYRALRVLIGKAEGKNWWCVMFPSLCFVDETFCVVPEESKDTLKEVLTDEEYEEIDSSVDEKENEEKKEDKVEYRSFLADLFTGN